jgi:hypothetical protein
MHRNLKCDHIEVIISVLCCVEQHVHSRPRMSHYEPTFASLHDTWSFSLVAISFVSQDIRSFFKVGSS